MSHPQASPSDVADVAQFHRSQISFHWRVIILFGLSCQTSAFVLLRRYSAAIKKEKYDKTSVLLVAEIVKLAISILGIMIGARRKPRQQEELQRFTDLDVAVKDEEGFARLRTLVVTSGPMFVQAVIYLAQNIIAFLALERLDGGTYSVLMQGKIFATAIFSMSMLSSMISLRQWRALLMLVLAVVQITQETIPTQAQSAVETHRYIMGLTYTFANVVLCGFSTVFMEKTFKDIERNLTLWERNFQLAFCSIFVYIGIALNSSGTALFANWTWLAVAISLVASVGGILVALALKYTDSILKSMASTLAIVMTTVFEWAFMDGPMNIAIAIGATFVILSVYNYHDH